MYQFALTYIIENMIASTFTKKWSSFVSSYKDSKYGGDRFMSDYNEYINSGKAKKVTMSDYIFR